VYSAYHWESGRPFPGPDVWIDIYTRSDALSGPGAGSASALIRKGVKIKALHILRLRRQLSASSLRLRRSRRLSRQRVRTHKERSMFDISAA
jgi:hypothetical protein